MVLTGAWPLLTNTVGIKTTDFVLLLMNSGNGMQMFSPEGGKILLTTTLGKRSKWNSYSTACLLRVGTRGPQKLMISWQRVLEFILKISGRSTCTPPLCFGVDWGGFRVEQQPLMNSFGHSGIEDTRTACQLHEMSCFEGFCPAQEGYHRQR